MNREEVLKIILKLENDYDVNQLKIGENIDIWPFLRVQLLLIWFGNTRKNDFETKRLSMVSRVKKIVTHLLLLPNQLRVLSKLKDKQVGTLFVGSNSHHVVVDGKSQNRFYCHFFKKMEATKLPYIYLNLSEGVVKINSENLNIVSLQSYYILKNKLNRKSICNPGVESILIDLIEEFAKLAGISNAKIKNALDKRLLLFKANADLYNKITSTIAIEKIMILCYYDSAMMPLIHYGNKYNIPTIDMQHGGQGEQHLAYARFTKIPNHGYNILPKYFWLWDKDSELTIHEWQREQTYHKTIVGGNPWLLYNKSIALPDTKDSRRIILYTMQFATIEPELHELIKNTSSSYHWQLKPHPRWTAELDLIRNVLREELDNGKVTILDSDLNLISLLQNCFVHVSKYSGSIIEAEQIGKFSIIIDPIGIESFTQIIDNGNAYGLTEFTSDNFNQILVRIGDSKKQFGTQLNLGKCFDCFSSIV